LLFYVQEVILNDVDKGVDEAQGKMDQAIKGIEKLLKTKDRCQLVTIAVLVLIFVIVTAVALS
jgi:t-SNARE complex subunit (syntaxin)